MNIPLQRVVVLDAVTRTEHDGLERHVRHPHRHLRLALDARGSPRNSPPPPTRYMPRTRKSCDSSGGAFERQRMTDATIDETTSSIAYRISSGVSTTVFGRPGHQVAAAHLGLTLVVGRDRPSRWPS